MDALLATFLEAGVEVLSFGIDDAAEAGDIRTVLETKGMPIGPYDLLIAAQARRRGASAPPSPGRRRRRPPPE